MNLDIEKYEKEIAELMEGHLEIDSLHNHFSSLLFKCKKTHYHFAKITNIATRAANLENENYFDDIHRAAYFELENFLITIRSAVDILMHINNESLSLGLKDVYLHHVYKQKKLPHQIKNIFNRFTRHYDNPIWNFIYTYRNEVIHAKSIDQFMTINIDVFAAEKPLLFLLWESEEREAMSFLKACIHFLESFISENLQAIRVCMLERH